LEQVTEQHLVKKLVRRNAMYMSFSDHEGALNRTDAKAKFDWNDANLCTGNVDDVYQKSNRPLARGGFGEVFKASLKADASQEFVLKQIGFDPKNFNMPKDWMLESEVTVGRIKAPFVAGIRDVFVSQPRMTMALPYMPGGELFDDCERDPYARMAQVAYGLWALHQQNIIWGDIKLDNVLLDKKANDAKVVLADFGLSSVCTPEKLACGTHLGGTPGFIAPNVWTGGPYGPEVDWFGYGILIWMMHLGIAGPYDPAPNEAGTAQKTYMDECMRVQSGPCEFEENAKYKALSSELRNLIAKMIKPAPGHYFQLKRQRKEMVNGWDLVAHHPILKDEFWLSKANSEFLERIGQKPSAPSKKTLQQFWGSVCKKYAMDPCLCPSGFQPGGCPAPVQCPKKSCLSSCER
jgi:serine/threonine protein kinase